MSRGQPLPPKNALERFAPNGEGRVSLGPHTDLNRNVLIRWA